jgi:hypothetical protein
VGDKSHTNLPGKAIDLDCHDVPLGDVTMLEAVLIQPPSRRLPTTTACLARAGTAPFAIGAIAFVAAFELAHSAAGPSALLGVGLAIAYVAFRRHCQGGRGSTDASC